VLKDAPGSRALLLGNEAIVRGALEAGCAVATGYPGTPASEIGDTFARVADERLLHFEYSVNEKVAYEAAHGACLGGVRSICSMKHLGLNVAADPLVTSAYVGTVGGFVIVSAADPGCHTSPNEQDHRYLARMSYIPVLDPTDPAEAHAMAREAFTLSERWKVPVLLRPTTRIAHTQGVVTLGALPPRPGRGTFTSNPQQYVPIPPNARRERLELIERMRTAAVECEDAPFNALTTGSDRLGIVTTGVAHAYVLDALDELDLTGKVSVLKLGIPYPLARGLVKELVDGCREIVVVEELEPFLEERIKAAAAEAGRSVRVRGKGDGLLPTAGEYGPGLVRGAIAEAAGIEVPRRPAPAHPPALPPRPAILCAGCPHRSSFQAVTLAVDEEAVFMNDIGCYTLGYGKPFDAADVLLSMGSCIPQGSGLGAATGRKAVAFIGDSTFFHAGITGLVNASYNRHDLLIVVLDNRITGMTGHQPSPAMEDAEADLKIEDVARACGAAYVQVVDPMDQREAIRVFREAYARPGLKVVVSRAPCPVHEARTRGLTEVVYEVDHTKCSTCHVTCGHAACGMSAEPELARLRAEKRILSRPLGTAPGLAPCTAACPADLCVQGFIQSFQTGHLREAYRIIRESLPLPGVLARICPRFCEHDCVRTPVDGAVAINDIKRTICDLVTDEDRAAVRETLRGDAPPSGKRVAVVGAGPAGLSAANDLSLMGHDVTILEARERAGGLLDWAIPEFRLPRDVVQTDVQDILDLGVTLETGKRLGRDFTTQQLLDDGFDAVFLGLGAGRGRPLRIPGETADGILDVIDLLERVSTGERPEVGRRALVIGGGDAAMDAARTALRLGAEHVTVLYRRTAGEMPAAAHEIEQARAEGVDLQVQAVPVEVLATGGRVSGLRCQRTEQGPPDEDGRRRPVPVEGTAFELEADSIIVAIGQGPADYPDTALTPDGFIDVDHITAATADPRVFAAGDAVLGPATVVGAVAGGRTAARAIDRMLRGQDGPESPLFRRSGDGSGASELVPEDLERKQRLVPPSLAPGEARGTFDEMETGASHAQALREASRCLGCGTCARCDACITTFGCPAFYRDADGLIQIDEKLCNGCGVCALMCPNGAIRPAGGSS
jgi:indolepyruvate ferredoxin oxidoreductase alpha subunit